MSNDTDGIFLLLALAMDNVTFAICIKDNTPSSILVPELDIIEIIGQLEKSSKINNINIIKSSLEDAFLKLTN